MQVAALFLGGLLFALASAFASCDAPPGSTATPLPAPSPTPGPPATAAAEGPQPRVVIAGQAFTVEIADDAASRARGLSGRASLPGDHGMLFVFAQELQPAFWMKDTLIPLDAVFISRDLRVVSVQTMQPEPGVPDSQLRRYLPPSPVLYVLELNAGTAAERGIAEGAAVELKLR